MGFTLVDLTVRQKWEPDEVKIKLEKAAGPPRRKGLSLLSNCLIHDGNKISVSAGFELTVPTEEKPEMVMVVSPSRTELPAIHPFNWRSSEVQRAVVRRFGKRIGMAANSNQLQRYLDNGSKRVSDELFGDILKEYQTNPKIEQHYRNYRAESKDLSFDCDNLIATVRSCPILRSEFKLPDPLDDASMDYVLIYESFYDWETKNNKHLKAISELVAKWTASKELAALVAKLKDNHLVCLVDTHDVKRAILNGTPQIAAKTREFLAYIMKG
jgi:hypothetical protein